MTEKVLITPTDLSSLANGRAIVLIDTRDPAAYAAGHLPGAVNIHDIFTYLATSTPEGVAAKGSVMRHGRRRACPSPLTLLRPRRPLFRSIPVGLAS